MAFGSIGERLALIIDADATGAITAIKKVGDTSEQQFSKAQTSQEKWSKGLMAGGAAAVGVAAVVGKGLLTTVHAYEGYEEAELKLQNTESRMPQLAGASSKAFNDLANKISDTTEVDRDGVIAGMALLGTFGLTQRQILRLTPLVVDLSQKTGINLNTAFRLVGKTVETGTNGLLRNGIVIDKTKLSTDAFGATVTALSQKVGGFATQQGKSFEGRLDIMHNELHDLAEGVGKGATEQLTSMLGSVEGLATGFGHLSSSTQANVGRIGVIGTTAVGSAGAVALLGGALLRMKGQMVAADGESGVLGTSLSGLGFGTVATAAVAAGVGLYAYGKQVNATKVDVDSLAQATNHELVTAWEAGRQQFASFMGTVGAKKEDLVLFRMLAEQNVGTAARLRDALAKAGYSVDGYDSILKKAATSQAQANRDTQSGADIVAKYGSATTGTTGQVEDLTTAVNNYRDAMDAATQKTLDIHDAQRTFGSDLREITTDLLDVHDKQVAYTQAVQQHGAKSEVAIRAQVDYENAIDAVGGAVDNTKRAMLDLAAKTAGASSETDAVSNHTTAYVAALEQVAGQLAPNSQLRVWLDQYISQLHNVPSEVTTHFDTSGGNQGGTHAGPIRHYAAGGDPPVGQAVMVGEHGPEPVVFDHPAHVYPTGTRMSAAGGDGVHVHLHVTPGFGSNAKQFMRDLGDELMRDARSGGPVTIAIRKAVNA